MPDQISTVREYFDRLQWAFAAGDPAVAQDALYDAQEFLAAERAGLAGGPSAEDDEAALVSRLITGFGHPDEVVESYRATEAQVAAALAPPAPAQAKSFAGRILGVFVEPRSYAALFFMLLSLPLGIIYFTWAVTGLSLSIGLGILIFGFFFFLFFMSTVRAVALVECRIVETMLGERMPRRPQVVTPPGSWPAKVKFWVTDRRTWLTLVYMILRLPLGVLYFTLASVFLAFALGFLAAPLLQPFFDFPIIRVNQFEFYLPFAFLPLFWLAAALDLLIVMHLARAVGYWHGRMAKAMLARPGA